MIQRLLRGIILGERDMCGHSHLRNESHQKSYFEEIGSLSTSGQGISYIPSLPLPALCLQILDIAHLGTRQGTISRLISFLYRKTFLQTTSRLFFLCKVLYGKYLKAIVFITRKTNINQVQLDRWEQLICRLCEYLSPISFKLI